jgi:hypothetical protein
MLQASIADHRRPVPPISYLRRARTMITMITMSTTVPIPMYMSFPLVVVVAASHYPGTGA